MNLKKVDKNKVVFISVISLIVIFLSAYTMSMFSEDESEEASALQNTFIPELDNDVEDYNSRLQAVDDEVKPITSNIMPDMYKDKKAERQRIIDSIYANGQMKYEKPKTTTTAAPQKKWSDIKKEVTTETEKEHDEFFTRLPDDAGLYDTNNTPEMVKATDSIILAEVNGDQKVRANGRVEMRLLQDAIINGKAYDKNTYVYGFVQFGPNRCFIQINHIMRKPISLEVYDFQDGGRGLHVLNSFTQDASSQVLDESVGRINIPGLPQVRGIQNIFRRNNRRVKVTVVNKYQILLKPSNDV